MISPARTAAFDILLRVAGGAYASELLHGPRLHELSPADRNLTTELVMGVLRWQSRLDAVAAGAMTKPPRKLDMEVLVALRLGVYQLGFLGRVPASAAVNESVELVKRARKRSAAALVNAVLRRLSGGPNRINPLRLQPLGPQLTPRGLADLYAHPEWLIERWARRFGGEAAFRICLHDQLAPSPALRLHAGEARDSAALDDALRRDGVQLGPGALLASARRVASGDVTRTAAFREGRIAIQDEASQLVALLVGHGERVLDLCAAPGGKTAAIAERNPAAQVVAVELHPHRARLLRERVRAANVAVIAGDAEALPLAATFDRVLADVPCSGTGTLARHPEIKWRLEPDDLPRLHARQLAILRAAMQHTAPGGRLVYATCSLEPEEGEDVVQAALAAAPHFSVLPARAELDRLRAAGELTCPDLDSLLRGDFLLTLPGRHPCDGFFAAVLQRDRT